MNCMCGCGQAGKSFFVRGHNQRVAKEIRAGLLPQPIPRPCACGCGQMTRPTVKYPTPRFVSGHQLRDVKGRGRKRLIAPAGKAPSGLCGCGCGRRTSIAKRSARARGHYIGLPYPYVSGHGPRKRGSAHRLWKGGRYIQRGYVMCHAPDHPSADSKGYVPEHRLVMERVLGRPLTRDEHVHHLNEVKNDNRPENLQVMTRAEHARKHGKTEWMHSKTPREVYAAAGRKGAAARWGKAHP